MKKLQVGDLFLHSNKNKTGLIVEIDEKTMYGYKIQWSCGTVNRVTGKEIYFWISRKEMSYFPVVK